MIDRAAAGVKATPRIPYQFRAQPVALEKLNLPSTAGALFTIILDESKRRGWRTKLQNAALAARLNRSIATIKRLLSLLESRGLIAREFIADGRFRTWIKVTWEGVAPPQSTNGCTVAHSRSTNGCTVAHSQAGGGSLSSREVAHSQAPIPESAVHNDLSNGRILESRDGKTEDAPPLTGEMIRAAIAAGIAESASAAAPSEPRPTRAETAAAIRETAAGEFAPKMFGAAPSQPAASPPAPAKPPAPKMIDAAPLEPSQPAASPTTPAKPPAPPNVGIAQPGRASRAVERPERQTTPQPAAPFGGFDLRRVGVSAVAAVFSPSWGAVRNTPESLMRGLRERRARIDAGGSPPPVSPRPGADQPGAT